MIEELDRVVLIVDVQEHGLKAGDIGVVVLVHGEHEGYELEFITLDGETIAVISAFPSQVRPIESGEIAHVRRLESA
jgi:hypothetical protein